MITTIPSVPTLLRAPERAALGLLHSALAVARNALLAAHPELALERTADPLDRALRKLLRRLQQLDVALERYVRADDHREPDDDRIF